MFSKRFCFCLSLFVLFLTVSPIFSVFASNSVLMRQQQRSFFIESQPECPLLIREFSAVILPKGFRSTIPIIEIVFYVENQSKKKVKRYSYQDPPEDAVDYADYQERGWSSTDLLPGASQRHISTMSIEGKAVVYRIKEVEFEDGTKWKAAPFKAAKAIKSARISSQAYSKPSGKLLNKRTSLREWNRSPIFADRLLKTMDDKTVLIEGIQVQTKLHELKRERLDFVESCHLEGAQKNSGEIDFDVEKFTTYEIKGKIFAYEIDYEIIAEEDGDRIGATIGLIYVDDEGTGKFTARCDATLKSLPNWVKNLAIYEEK